MSTTLVIARYAENLDWLLRVPAETRIVVYNKGQVTTGAEIPERADVVEDRRNFGRESETFLHHVLNAIPGGDGFTIFCQGDPFSHSPDFLKLLEHQDSWADIQPLSDRWLDSNQVPPAGVLAEETGEQVHGLV